MSASANLLDTPAVSRTAETYYLRSDVRRTALEATIGIVGFILINLPNGMVFRPIHVLIGILLGVVLVRQVLCLLSVIRIDHRGISRRVLWWWDLWPWEAFADGRVQFGKREFSYAFSDRLIGGTLRLDWLSQRDAQVVIQQIRGMRESAPPRPTADEVTFRMTFPDRRRVQLSDVGITLCKGHHEVEYRWDEILKVTIWRFEAGRGDFKHLWIQLPDQYLKLDRGDRFDNWTGCAAEDVSAIICRNIDLSRLEDFALHGLARTVEELDGRWRHQDLGRNERFQAERTRTIVMSVMILALGLLMASWQMLLWASYSVYSILQTYRKQVIAMEAQRGGYESQRDQLLRESVGTLE